ncbi:uncharacterized protein N7498_006410 [Penicillium cinerascens]|uniref:Hydrophobin n=1 Tax=Penicillium cinerascens TaxID=70096 RepID=A0A9W9MI60_9EURO|nr:uncharacterized protein N7498_006410 [Penicillium cinerascens]KAJ5201747.1 hypothetical protein N7498_006410 [Penicillium cinerascens]
MKFFIAVLALAATAIAGRNMDSPTCEDGSSVVCKGNGDSGVISLGNVAAGAAGENCATGAIYCCSEQDIKDLGVVNLNLNIQCSLNQVL